MYIYIYIYLYLFIYIFFFFFFFPLNLPNFSPNLVKQMCLLISLPLFAHLSSKTHVTNFLPIN